jgi:hypothetical protein
LFSLIIITKFVGIYLKFLLCVFFFGLLGALVVFHAWYARFFMV